MDIQKEELLEIFRQRNLKKKIADNKESDEVRAGDVFLVLRKEEYDFIIDTLYDFLESSKDKNKSKLALQTIKYMEGE